MKVSVIVHPNSKQPRIVKDLTGMLHVYVHEPPLDGKANKAVVEALSSHFQTKKSKIVLISGEKSKYKIFVIEDK